MNVSSSTSSIYAHQNLLDSSAHNTANSNTENFERTDTRVVENGTNGVKTVSTQEENNTPYSNTDLVKEMTDQIVSYNVVGANAISIQTQNDVSGTLLDIKA
jgi:flagellar hook protein FlgE